MIHFLGNVLRAPTLLFGREYHAPTVNPGILSGII